MAPDNAVESRRREGAGRRRTPTKINAGGTMGKVGVSDVRGVQPVTEGRLTIGRRE